MADEPPKPPVSTRPPTPIPGRLNTPIPPRPPTPYPDQGVTSLVHPIPTPLTRHSRAPSPPRPSTPASSDSDESSRQQRVMCLLRRSDSLEEEPSSESTGGEGSRNKDKDITAGYSDPTADVVLKSGDGKNFRVHSYMLKANSDVFHDMLVADHVGTPGQAIELDTSSELLRRFLDLMHETTWRPTGTYEECKELLEVTAKYGAPRLAERILCRIAECDDVDAWDMFALASQYDHIGLAKLAIQSMGGYGHYMYIEEIDTRAAEKVRAPYLVALFKTLSRASRGDSSTPTWYEISAKFTLRDRDPLMTLPTDTHQRMYLMEPDWEDYHFVKWTMTVPAHSAPSLNTAEVLLQCNNGKVFAVLASVITAQSAMFRDMLEGSTAEQLTVPIQLDIESEAVQHFVNVLINDDWAPGMDCKW